MRFFVMLLMLCIASITFANSAKPSINIQNLALQKAYLQSIDCRSTQKVSSLINSAIKQADDYAAKANNASVLEEIMVNNPPFFIQALNQLPTKACLQFKEQFIEETFFYPRDDIKNALATAKNYSKSCIAS